MAPPRQTPKPLRRHSSAKRRSSAKKQAPAKKKAAANRQAAKGGKARARAQRKAQRKTPGAFAPKASAPKPEPLKPSPQRRGPRPLALHLATAGFAWSSLRAALPLIAAGKFPWTPALAEQAAALLRDNPGRHDGLSAGEASAAIAQAIDRIGEQRLLEFTAGVQAYRAHSYRRSLAEPPALWSQGTTRLLDYGAIAGTRGAQRSRGPTVLVVPSLVNRAHVLDLTAETSLLRHLAAQGIQPLLVDWGAPGTAERSFDLTDYIAGRLAAALDAATAAAGGPVIALGYCMGGNLALALAQLCPRDVSAVALLATPWDFQADGPIRAPLEPTAATALAAAFDGLPEFPVDLLQAMFATLDPFLVARKYRAFAAQAQGADAARADMFVALEDWANDGVPLASRVARECLVDWYGRNTPARGLWQVAGETITPERFDRPALLMMPQQDRIVPPASSAALAEAMPRATALQVPSGHVAMIVGRQAQSQTWTPLVRWLMELGGRDHARRRTTTKTIAKRSSSRR